MAGKHYHILGQKITISISGVPNWGVMSVHQVTLFYYMRKLSII